MITNDKFQGRNEELAKIVNAINETKNQTSTSWSIRTKTSTFKKVGEAAEKAGVSRNKLAEHILINFFNKH